MQSKLAYFISVMLFSTSVCAQLTVMTYNIRNSNANDGVNSWKNRKQKLFDVIKQANPKVFGTQEVLKDQLKDLQQAFPEYNAYGVGRSNGRHAGEHSAVFYKRADYDLMLGGNFWLSETPGIAGSKSWDAALTRICTWVKLREKSTGNEFFVFNTHFDHKGKEARRKSAALIRSMVDSLAGLNPVLVMGDFNFTPTDTAYRIMTDNNSYRISLGDSRTDDSLSFTDCGFNVSNKNCNRIDYVFYSKGLERIGYKVHTDNDGTYYPSDHLAVSAVFNF